MFDVLAQQTLEVHVTPVARTGMWAVHEGDPSVALSLHFTQTDALRAATAHADESGSERIVIHDRYHRTRSIPAHAA